MNFDLISVVEEEHNIANQILLFLGCFMLAIMIVITINLYFFYMGSSYVEFSFEGCTKTNYALWG